MRNNWHLPLICMIFPAIALNTVEASQPSNKELKYAWNIKDPLYEELFSSIPAGLARQGTIYWAHGANAKDLRLCAQQYGFPYSYQFWIDQTNENLLRPFTNYKMLKNLSVPNTNSGENSSAAGSVQYIYLAGPRGDIDYKFKFNNVAFLPDPEVRKQFIGRMAEVMEKQGDILWGVSAGDEQIESMDICGVLAFEVGKDAYPYIVQADQEIKQKYGAGKYGIPLSARDTNPYRWIAYRRWLNEQMTDILKEFYQTARGINPDVKVIAYNNGSPRPCDYSSWTPYCDVISQQMLSRCVPYRAHFGFSTKLTKDISGTDEFWACTHLARPPIFDSDHVRELMSQVYRNGGTGFHFWTCDYYGRKAKKKYMHYEYYIAPDRWDTMMAITNEVRHINRLKFPEADSAVLYSCDSFAAVPSKLYSDPAEVIYTFLGPKAQSAFKFIDDNQIQRNQVDLSDFKVVYIPLIKYVRPDVLDALAAYVKQGGIIVTVPEAFDEDPVGNSLKERKKELLGFELGKEIEVQTLSDQKFKGLKIYDTAYELDVDKELVRNLKVKILARFDGGQPAIVAREIGEGQIISFAVNPFKNIKIISDEDWASFFKKMHSDFGLKVDQDVWRFKFPQRLSQAPMPLKGVCLTNNYIYWQTNTPITKQNVDTQGSYTYSRKPDGIADRMDALEIPFDKGDLTDRREAPMAGNVDSGLSKIEDWVVRFDDPSEFDITFDFKKAYPLGRVRIVYTGLLPDIELEGSADGELWLPLPSSMTGKNSDKAVYMEVSQGEWGEFQF